MEKYIFLYKDFVKYMLNSTTDKTLMRYILSTIHNIEHYICSIFISRNQTNVSPEYKPKMATIQNGGGGAWYKKKLFK